MKITVNDRGLYISEMLTAQRVLLEEQFTFQDCSLAYFAGKFDRSRIIHVSFLREKEKGLVCRSGLLQDIVTFCRALNWPFSFSDLRTRLPFQSQEYSYDFLRGQYNKNFTYVEHQIEALSKLLKTSRGIIKMPTSAGKTEVISSYIKICKVPVLLLVNKQTLASQLLERIKENGAGDFGIWSGVKKVDGKDGLIALIGSVASYPNLGRFKVIIADEVHNASAATYQEFLSKVQIPICLGFSATPNKGDLYKYALVKQFFGAVVCEVQSAVLIENEVMVKPKIFFVENYVGDYLTWPATYENCNLKNDKRNQNIVDIALRYNLPTLILINDVKNKQGEWIRKRLEDEGKRVEFISGEMANKERMKIINGFDENQYDVLIGTTVLNEGISIKSIRLFINGSAGKSKSQTLQKIGRSLRKKEGKHVAYVFDFCDTGNKFTSRHFEQRRVLYKREGYTDIRLVSEEEMLNLNIV